MKLPTRLILALALSLFAAVAAYARCVATTPAENFKDAQTVFRGRITNVGFRWFSGMQPVTFEVEQSWKGVDLNQVTIYAAPESGEGYQFKSGETYVVYAGQHNGKLYTGACSGTSALKDAASQLSDLSGRSLIPITKKVSHRYTRIVTITVVTVLLLLGIGYTVTRFMKRAA